eukprot:15482687-Alexandrium_andersonii.AAC.1
MRGKVGLGYSRPPRLRGPLLRACLGARALSVVGAFQQPQKVALAGLLLDWLTLATCGGGVVFRAPLQGWAE